jgi:hypothetical protein
MGIVGLVLSPACSSSAKEEPPAPSRSAQPGKESKATDPVRPQESVRPSEAARPHEPVPDTPPAVVAARYRLKSAKDHPGMFEVPGAPFVGSAGLTVSGGREFAGLTLVRPTTLRIHEDGTLLAEEVGVGARDGDGRAWESQRVGMDGRALIVFLPVAP